MTDAEKQEITVLRGKAERCIAKTGYLSFEDVDAICCRFIALLADQEGRGEVGWQPIATAPKDGTRILVTSNWRDVNDKPLGVEISHWAETDEGWLSCEREPTFWQPLPAPPQEPKP